VKFLGKEGGANGRCTRDSSVLSIYCLHGSIELKKTHLMDPYYSFPL
jgi:hypothetical protein